MNRSVSVVAFLLGLAVVAVTVFAAGQSDVRHQVEAKTLEWLQGRHEVLRLRRGRDQRQSRREQRRTGALPPNRHCLRAPLVPES